MAALKKIAHRGASGEYPENTQLAFVRAIEARADMIELDVQRSADGVLVEQRNAVEDGRAVKALQSMRAEAA